MQKSINNVNGSILSLLSRCWILFQDIAAAPVQDAPLMGKFKLKGKGEKHKIKAAKQQISVEPSNLMNGEDGKHR